MSGEGSGEVSKSVTSVQKNDNASNRGSFATFANHKELEAEDLAQDQSGQAHLRDRWPSRLAFYLAAIGSAVGFGNVWRFPALAKDYGGGAFFVPYLLALFIVGLPVLILEIGLGQFYQTGNVGVFGRFHARFRGVGVSAVACGYILVTYYSMLLAWCCNTFFSSFSESSSPWAKEGMTGQDGVSYFYNTIIGMETLGDDQRPTRLVPANVGYAALVWAVIYLCLAFGLKWTGRIAYFTMGLPIILLFVFLGRAVTLPGAEDGIHAYIGVWDMSVLTESPEVWSVAVSQIFFSLSVTFGTMTAYGSHCPRGEPVFLNSTVIGISNSLFSFISGFAVFATLGYSAYLLGIPVDDIPYSGFSLVFGTWPIVFGTLPGGVHWVRLIFFTLFLLGIDSAFSIMEGPITITQDHKRFMNSKKWIVAGVFCITAFVFSLIYATDAGLIFLDTIDFYINFILLLVGFFETFGAGWVYGIEEQIQKFGPHVVLTYMFTNFASVVIGCGLWFGLKDGNAVWAGFVGLIGTYLVGIAATWCLLQKRMTAEPDEFTAGSASVAWELAFGNVLNLTAKLRGVVGYMPVLWGILLKQFIPHILLILFINAARADNGDGESLLGHYEGYVTWPFQVLGILCLVFAGCLTLVGIAFPSIYEAMDIPARKEVEYQGKHTYSMALADPQRKEAVDKQVQEPIVEATEIPEENKDKCSHSGTLLQDAEMEA